MPASAAISQFLPMGPVPAEVAGKLNLGAFLLAPFWSAAHNVWIGLLCFLPGAGLPMAIILLFKGNEWGWLSRNFQSVGHFDAVQSAWRKWGIIVAVTEALLVIAFFVLSFILPLAFVGAALPHTTSSKVKVVQGDSYRSKTLSGSTLKYEADAGKTFLVMTVTVTNGSSEKATVGASDFELTCDNKNVYHSEDSMSDSGVTTIDAELLPGGETTGQIVFQIAEGADPVSLTYF